MSYLKDIYFDNLNIVYNAGDFFSIVNKDWTYPRHRFEQCKFYFITKGNCVIEIEGKTYNGKAGDWFFIPANTEHSYYNIKSAPFEKYWAHFDLLPNTDICLMLDLPFKISIENISPIQKLFKKLTETSKNNEFISKITIKSTLLQLLGEYIKFANPSEINLSFNRDERLNKVLNYINDNLDKPFCIDTLSKIYFAHPTHFIRVFKEKTGTSPLKYVRQKKMEKAKTMLEFSNLSTSEIAEKLALTDSAHFCKLFKEYYNTSPSNYRKFLIKK